MQYTLQHFFPRRVAWYMSTENAAGNSLFSIEEKLCKEYSPARRAEFATGRYCARQALRQLGYEEQAISKGEWGQPLWPEGVVGSISHSFGLTIAVAARTSDCTSIGLDVEKTGRIERNLWEMFFQSGEIAFLESLPAEQQLLMSTMIYGMKEAFYKMIFPLIQNQTLIEQLDFQDLRVSLKPDHDFKVEMKSRIEVKGHSSFTGKFVVLDDYILCFCTM